MRHLLEEQHRTTRATNQLRCATRAWPVRAHAHLSVDIDHNTTTTTVLSCMQFRSSYRSTDIDYAHTRNTDI